MLKIKELRLKNNLTQDELCQLTGIKKRSLLDYESGKTDIPFSKLHNIAIALKISIYDLIEEENPVATVQEAPEEYVKRSNIPLLLEQIELLKVASNTKNEIIALLKDKLELIDNELENCKNEKNTQKVVK
jgi:transcriptional regulator with XRE-family HTH domain